MKKNKNLEKIKNSNILLKIKEYKEYYIIEININSLTAPSQRPRTTTRNDHFYDPLESYKKYIQKNIKNIIKEKYQDFKIIEGNIEIKIDYSMIPPISWSKIRRYNAIKGFIKPIVKPDNDNIEKTIFDTLNKIIWKDDNQIIKNETKKFYNIEEFTNITIKGYKNDIQLKNKRINKNIINGLSQKEKEFLDL